MDLNTLAFVIWMILGAIFGLMAGKVMGRDDNWMKDLLLGVFGAVGGGVFVALLMPIAHEGGLSTGLLGSFFGAMIMLAGRRAFETKTRQG